jgi:hypothetical protein
MALNKCGMAQNLRGRNLLALLLAFMLILTMVFPLSLTAVAHTDPDDDDDKEPDVKVEKALIRIDNQIESKNAKENLEIEVSNEKEIRVSIGIDREDEKAKTRSEFTLKFNKVVFFKDSDGNKRLGGGDEVQESFEIEKMDFYEPYYKKITDDHHEAIHMIEIKSKDKMLEVTITTNGEFSTENGEITPPSISLQVRIYNEQPCPKPATALELKLRSESKIRVVPTQGKPVPIQEHAKDGNTAESVFIYNKYATVDGKESGIEAVKEEKPVETSLTLNYPEGQEINHDLAMGTLPAFIVLHGDILIYGATAGLIVAVAVMTEPRILGKFARKK